MALADSSRPGMAGSCPLLSVGDWAMVFLFVDDVLEHHGLAKHLQSERK